jgi:hypothetical protein
MDYLRKRKGKKEKKNMGINETHIFPQNFEENNEIIP